MGNFTPMLDERRQVVKNQTSTSLQACQKFAERTFSIILKGRLLSVNPRKSFKG